MFGVGSFLHKTKMNHSPLQKIYSSLVCDMQGFYNSTHHYSVILQNQKRRLPRRKKYEALSCTYMFKNNRDVSFSHKTKENICSKTDLCFGPKTTSVVRKSQALVGLYHKCGILNLQMDPQVSSLSKKKGKKSCKTVKKAAAWEQVSCNDVVLTDVGQFSFFLPESVPVGARADTVCAHMLPPLSRLHASAGYWISVRLKSGPEVAALNASGGWNIESECGNIQRRKVFKNNGLRILIYYIT